MTDHAHYVGLVEQMRKVLKDKGPPKRGAFPEMQELYDGVDAFYKAQDKPGCIPFMMLWGLLIKADHDIQRVQGFVALGFELKRLQSYVEELEFLLTYQAEHYPHMFDADMDRRAVTDKIAKEIRKSKKNVS